MQSPNSVTTAAFDGLIEEIATEIGVSDKRLYDMLGRHNPYTKAWRILTPLGRLNPERLLLVQSDFNARVNRIVQKEIKPSTMASVHRELSQAMQTILDRAPKTERKIQILEAIRELQKELGKCDEGA